MERANKERSADSGVGLYGNGNTDHVFVVRSIGVRTPELSHDEVQISVGEFLQQHEAEQVALLDLIGTLVPEE